MKRIAVALIDESRCIGCMLCIDACPVDAIVGASQLMHTVVEPWCIGCALCLPPCPVDCIAMLPPRHEWNSALKRAAGERARHRKTRLQGEKIRTHNTNRKKILAEALERKKRG
jgi:electron transport complex protein RnfB